MTKLSFFNPSGAEANIQKYAEKNENEGTVFSHIMLQH